MEGGQGLRGWGRITWGLGATSACLLPHKGAAGLACHLWPALRS